MSKVFYAFRRKGQDSFCTCDKARYLELSQKPNMFEVAVFYTAPQPDVQTEPDAEPFGYLYPTGTHPEFRYFQNKRDGVDGMPVYTAPQPAKLRAAAQQAWTALERGLFKGEQLIAMREQAITALRDALAEQCSECNGMGIQDGKGDKCPLCDGCGDQPAKPAEQSLDGKLAMGLAVIRELTGTQKTDNIEATIEAVRKAVAPQPAKREPLTEAELSKLVSCTPWHSDETMHTYAVRACRALERAHGIGEKL